MSNDAQHARAGLSFLFGAGERPDTAALRGVVDASRAHVVHEGPGALEIVTNGLTFDMDGLAPQQASPATAPLDGYGFGTTPHFATLEAIRLYPGHHLSGGLSSTPVVRAIIALAADIAVALPVRAVLWHPASTAIEPRTFAHTALAWLAGGTFPAPGLTALSALADGSVASRGLTHFVGQEVSVRGRPGEDAGRTMRLAASVIDRIVRQGRIEEACEMAIDGEQVSMEPAQRGNQVWVWRDADRG